MLIASSILTIVVLQVHEAQKPPQNLAFSVYSSQTSHSSQQVVVDYVQFPDETTRVRVRGLPAGGELYIGPLASGSHCLDRDNRQVTQAIARQGDVVAGGDVVRIALREVPSGFIFCSVKPLILDVSFVDRELDATYYDLGINAPSGEQPLSWILDLSGISSADNMRFNGGIPATRWETDRRIEQREPWTEAFWENKWQVPRRNMLLVVIGALIALGAAMLLEALRPYVDIIAARSTRHSR